MLDVVELVRRLLPALQRDAAARHVATQLWRAATGGGSNYEEARGAESLADFLHKLRVATNELRETMYSLRVVERSDWTRARSLASLIDEVDQLIAILVASARTVRAQRR
jgi:four helix bundle protein